MEIEISVVAPFLVDLLNFILLKLGFQDVVCNVPIFYLTCFEIFAPFSLIKLTITNIIFKIYRFSSRIKKLDLSILGVL